MFPDVVVKGPSPPCPIVVEINHELNGFLGECQAEDRLRKFGKERGFLSRQSDVRPGFFILTFLDKG